MKTVKQTNIEGGIDEIEVVDAQEVKSKKGTVTMKTLKAWIEQTNRILEDAELTKKEELQIIVDYRDNVKNRFIENKFWW